MSDTMVSALISAVVGAFVGGLLAYFINRPQTVALRKQVKVMSDERDLMRLQLQIAQGESDRGRIQPIVDPVLRLAAKIIAPVTLDCSSDEAERLRVEWGQTAKQLYIFVADPHVWREINDTVMMFLHTLVNYKLGTATREAAEDARQAAASKLRAITPGVRTAIG